MDLLNDPDINAALKKYVLLTCFAGDFANEDDLNIYYNQLLESGDQFENIDWVECKR